MAVAGNYSQTPGFNLRIRDVKGIVQNLKARDKKCVLEIQAAVRRNGNKLQVITQQLSPVDTGFMRDHVRLTFSSNWRHMEVGWYVEDFRQQKAFYPPYQEFGTRFFPAQPSLGPAYRRIEPQLQADIKKALADSLTRKGR